MTILKRFAAPPPMILDSLAAGPWMRPGTPTLQDTFSTPLQQSILGSKQSSNLTQRDVVSERDSSHLAGGILLTEPLESCRDCFSLALHFRRFLPIDRRGYAVRVVRCRSGARTEERDARDAGRWVRGAGVRDPYHVG
jgi:hypothetical protein